MNKDTALQKVIFYISEFRNFRNDGYVQLHYKNLIKELLVAISKSEVFTYEELSDIFQKEINNLEKEEILNLK